MEEGRRGPASKISSPSEIWPKGSKVQDRGQLEHLSMRECCFSELTFHHLHLDNLLGLTHSTSNSTLDSLVLPALFEPVNQRMDSPGPSDYKRRRLSPTSVSATPEEEEEYTPYVPVKKRRADFVASVTSRHAGAGGFTAAERKRMEQDAEDEDEKANGKAQRGTAQTLLIEAQEVKRLKAIEGKS